MHTATEAANRQGRGMARNDLKVEFGRWLDNELTARAMTQAELRKLLAQAGVEASRQTVSQWVNGENIPVPDTVVVIAEILGLRPADALRKAGHGRVAAWGEGARPSGELATAPPVDPTIQAILDDPAVPSDLKDRAIVFYRRRMRQAKEDLQDFGLRAPGPD